MADITIDEYLGPDDDIDYDSAPEAPRGADHANRLLYKARKMDAQYAETLDVIAAERERLDMFAADQQDRYLKARGWIETSLGMYHQARLAEDPKALTINLPNGTLKARTQQPEYVYDDDAFVVWATETLPDVLRQPDPPAPVPDKNKVKSAVKDKRLILPGQPKPGDTVQPVLDGELVPGLLVVIRPRKFTMELS